MRVAIIGSRNCKDLALIDILHKIPEECSVILSGGATGADQLAQRAAQELKLPFLKILPDYEKNGKRAPLIRNEMIVEKSDIVIAFWDYISRGTAATIAYCIEKRVPVKIYPLPEHIIED